MRDDLSTTRLSLSETETSRDGAAAASEEASAKLQTCEEKLLRSKREHDLLQAERSVWQVARSGIQEELAKVRGGEGYGVMGACVLFFLDAWFEYTFHTSSNHACLSVAVDGGVVVLSRQSFRVHISSD